MFNAFVGAACYIPIGLMPVEYTFLRDNKQSSWYLTQGACHEPPPSHRRSRLGEPSGEDTTASTDHCPARNVSQADISPAESPF
jgi:hypothetical protein